MFRIANYLGGGCVVAAGCWFVGFSAVDVSEPRLPLNLVDPAPIVTTIHTAVFGITPAELVWTWPCDNEGLTLPVNLAADLGFQPAVNIEFHFGNAYIVAGS